MFYDRTRPLVERPRNYRRFVTHPEDSKWSQKRWGRKGKICIN